jgi:phospholipid-binding lipoprotein MlaA
MTRKSRLHALMLATVTTLALVSLPTRSVLGAEAGKDDEFFDFDAANKDSGTPTATIDDPLEGLNRATFAFNDKAYRYVMKPVAKGLRVLPEPVLIGFSNFFSNLGAPVSAISALLQGEGHNALTELGRFVINTTAGLAGFLDPATDVGLVQDEEDLGQTMAKWGVGHGFYLVVPFYGPSSLRDFTGTLATSAANPLYYNLDTGETIGITAASAETSLSLDKDTYEAFYDGAVDPYVFFRSAWVQNRAGKIDK